MVKGCRKHCSKLPLALARSLRPMSPAAARWSATAKPAFSSRRAILADWPWRSPRWLTMRRCAPRWGAPAANWSSTILPRRMSRARHWPFITLPLERERHADDPCMACYRGDRWVPVGCGDGGGPPPARVSVDCRRLGLCRWHDLIQLQSLRARANWDRMAGTGDAVWRDRPPRRLGSARGVRIPATQLV